MIEIEIRSIINNCAEAEKKLAEKLTLKKYKEQVDEYFSHPSKNFYANPLLREYIRIRQGQEPVLEYHKAHIKNGKKTHTEEFEVKIESVEKMREILIQLGFKPLVTVKKSRKVFENQDFEACLDHIEELGTFIEIEAKKDFGGNEKTKQACIDFLKQLNLKYNPAPEKGYPDMLAEKLTQKE